MAKQKQPKFVTPKGVAVYPHLNAPDTKFDEDGKYHVKLRLQQGAPGVAKLMKHMDELADEGFAEAQKNPKTKKFARHLNYRIVEDEEGNETDEIEIAFETSAKFKNKKGEIEDKKPPVLFDSTGKPVQVKLGGGSLIAVRYTVGKAWANPTSKTCGVKIYLDAVMIYDLKTWGGTADASGFETDEDGFVADDSENDEDVGTEADDEVTDVPAGAEDF